MRLLSLLLLAMTSTAISAADKFPDGSIVPSWFANNEVPSLKSLGPEYVVTDFGVVNDSSLVQTQALQAVIDKCAHDGGGVIVIPQGTFMTGALFFRPHTHLHIKEGGKLKGSDDISDFPVIETRIEGQTRKYFPAVVNADRVNGFTLTGKGVLDGNGLRYWKHFWLRRSFNPQCTNVDEMRPRLVYISNSDSVVIADVSIQHSPFWSTHYYRCNFVKLLNISVRSPKEPVKAPSTDAVDIDVCSNFHIKGCYFAVNDDGVVLKGGKGPYADQDPNNGEKTNIIVEDCTYGFCHSAITFGSESIHDRNVIFRNNRVNGTERLLWLKMRPDTPQNYEYITVENVTGHANYLLYVMPWTQFFDLQGRPDVPMSYSSHVTLRNIDFDCATFFQVQNAPDQYSLKDFTFENLKVRATKNADYDAGLIANSVWKKVNVEKVEK